MIMAEIVNRLQKKLFLLSSKRWTRRSSDVDDNVVGPELPDDVADDGELLFVLR